MSNKSPYEIRSDVLAMAKEFMDKSYQMNLAHHTQLFEAGQKTVEEMTKAMTPYTMDELMEKASKMYNFVQDKGKS